ncbi:MAG: hypothetical protein ACLQOO_31285 [Terriglobia bacterium]
MVSNPKISVAFERYFAQSGPNDKRDAIVVYRAPLPSPLHVRGRLRALKDRLDKIKESATLQRPVQARLFKSYQTGGIKPSGDEGQLGVSAIGKNTLPIAWMEVTAEKLDQLAGLPEVLAVLPNLSIHAVRPCRVNYSALTKQESKDHVTWGLKKLGIPKLWKTTKGADINVAVLDTGVHGNHPALVGRLKEFVVIDPLGRRIKTDISLTLMSTAPTFAGRLREERPWKGCPSASLPRPTSWSPACWQAMPRCEPSWKVSPGL